MSQDVPIEILCAEKAAIEEVSRAVARLLRTLRALPYGKPAPAAVDTTTLPRPLALLLADLLDLASEEFSRHVCNDYDLPTDAEPAREAILRAYAAWDDKDFPVRPRDYTLMGFGAAVLRDPSLLEAGR